MINNSLINAGFSRDHKCMTMTPDGILGEVPIQICITVTPQYILTTQKMFFDVRS